MFIDLDYLVPTGVMGGVATRSLAQEQMLKDWHLVETLWGGTEAMREANKIYLPQEPKESDKAYEVRLQRTFLLNLYKRTITTVAGLAFLKPVVVSGVPEELEHLEFNIDGTGRSLTELAYDLTIDALHYGKSHAMVDFPAVSSDGMSLPEFRESGFRPYLSLVKPTSILGWREDENAPFDELEQLRVASTKVVPSEENPWADKQQYYVWVYHKNFAEVHTFDPELDEEYREERVVENTLGRIPMITAYSAKTGFLQATPPLRDLAEVNLCHWQSSSDQRNILHVARVPFLLASGFEEGELSNVEIGANRIIASTSKDASIKHVEHSGQAIGAGRQDIIDLQQQMGLLGADLLLSKSVSRQTATARKLDQTESMSVLQLTLRSVEQMLEQAYQIAGEWLGIDASSVSVSIGDDLSQASEPNPTAALIQLKDSGLLTDQQIVEEAKRQGILSSYFKLNPDRPNADESFGQEDSESGDMEDTTEIEQDQPEVDNEPDSMEELRKLLIDQLRA